MAEPYKIEIIISGEGAADVRAIESGLKGMKRAAGGVQASFRDVNAQLDRMFGQVTAIGRRLTLMGMAGAAAMGGLLYVGVKYNIQVEQMRKSLLIFLKTQEKVNEAYEWAADLTLRVPLTRRDVIPVMTMLEQYGLAYKEWAMTVIDAAAATKRPGESIQSQMDTITLAFGRIKFGDVGVGLEMLRRAGIAVEKAGIKFDSAGRVLDEPRVVLEKLKTYIDTEFLGAAEKFGKTWEGLVMTFKSLTERFIGAAVEPIFEKLRGILNSIIVFLKSSTGRAAIKEFGEMIADVFMKVIDVAVKAFFIIKPIIGKMFASERFKQILAYILVLGPAFLIIAGIILQVVGALGGMVTSIVLAVTAGAGFIAAIKIIAAILGAIIVLAVEMGAMMFIGFKVMQTMSEKTRAQFKKVFEKIGFYIYILIGIFGAFGRIVKSIMGSATKVVLTVIDKWIEWAGHFLEFIINVFSEWMSWVDKAFQAVGKKGPFEQLRKEYEVFKAGFGPGARMVPGGTWESAYEERGVGRGGIPEIPLAPVGGGGGGGGGGGRGGARGGVTVYQTLEYGAVLVYPSTLDRDSLLSMLESIGLEEAPTRG